MRIELGWKKAASFVLMLLLVFGAGCGANEGAEAPTEAPTAVPTQAVTVRQATTPWTDYLTEEDMQTASPWKSTDNAALAAVMKKAEAGEPVTIACIGGSITQGSISNGPLDKEIKKRACYADIFFAWWKETFPETEVTVINAGIGGTDSYLGVHRVQEDVLDYHPDLVLVEYSVNDGANNSYKNSYDNLVRRILKSEDKPAVLLLFMAQTNLNTAQNVHQLIGFNYGLPMISHYNLIKSFFENGRYTEAEMSGDVSHPSVFGHALVGEMLWKYLNTVYVQLDTYGEPLPFDKKALTKERYLNSELVGVGDITPDSYGTFAEKENFNGWGTVWSSTDGEGNIVFTVKCCNLGILFWRSTSGNYATYEVWVDGVYKEDLHAEFLDGWGAYAYSQEIFGSNEETEHTVMLKKKAGSAGDDFVLLRLMLSH